MSGRVAAPKEVKTNRACLLQMLMKCLQVNEQRSRGWIVNFLAKKKKKNPKNK
jgi:hypothetical protein